MRFLSSVFILSALSVLQVLARMNQLVSRTSHDHPTIARRQFHPSARSLVDICAQIDVSLSSKLSVVKILEASALVELHVCLCVSVVATFVKNDVRAKPYIDHFGEKNAITEIKELIRVANGRQACQFPPNSIPAIASGTSCDPCEYDCEDTFSKRDRRCVCDPGLHECNGKCNMLCGSSTPRE